MTKKIVAVSVLGIQLDFVGSRVDRWSKWRPNVSLCSQDDLIIDQMHLIFDNHHQKLARQILDDIICVSPETTTHGHIINFTDPWDFEEVYAKLFDWCQQQAFDQDKNDYLFHITTGTHVVQICGYLLTESRHFPGKLLQSAPAKQRDKSIGKVQIIDLDLSRYDQLASRFALEHQQGSDFLKGGINTLNPQFNALIEQIEKVAIRSRAPILLTGPTGAGKSQLATRIYQLKKHRSMLSGELVAVNCATLRGESAMAALFGHTKGAFTGALQARTGFLRSADKGVLFLDEIGELGLEEQAMLLSALETKVFYPVGSDTAQSSDFQLIGGTNRDLKTAVQEGTFREDLLARINLWSYQLPALKDRPQDIEPNIEFELVAFAKKEGYKVDFNQQARQRFIDFARSPQGHWRSNFRDLNAAITRMATLTNSSRITTADVEQEIDRLNQSWQAISQNPTAQNQLTNYLDTAFIATIDHFDAVQLAHVLSICEQQPSMAAAGRELFNVSRTQKKQSNDSSRLQKYLARFGITWGQLKS